MAGIQYSFPLWRPPSEANSLILQITHGCSWNRCTFCANYRSKQYSVKPLEQVKAEIKDARETYGADAVERVFLADGDAMCLSAPRLRAVLDDLNAAFPRLERVGIYANARDVLRKTPADLADLQRRKLGPLYIGLESGDDETLEKVKKGATAEEMIEAGVKARQAGLTTSVMVLIGLAGPERSHVHAVESARVINGMAPNYIGLLTIQPAEGTPLHEDFAAGKFTVPTPQQALTEMRTFIAGVDCSSYLTATHVTTYLPLRGRLPDQKADLLRAIDGALEGKIPLRPDFMRSRGL